MTTEIILVAVAGGIGIMGSLLGTIFQSRKDHEKGLLQSKREWKEKSVSEVLGPTYMLLERTHRAFKNWQSHHLYMEAEVMEKSNRKIRDILLENASLIPPELRVEASDFIEHFDAWLESYHKNRIEQEKSKQTDFTFVPDPKLRFPHKAEENFKKVYDEYWDELYKQKEPN